MATSLHLLAGESVVPSALRSYHSHLGLVIGRAKMNVFAVRAGELIQDRPELAAAVAPLLKTREVRVGASIPSPN